MSHTISQIPATNAMWVYEENHRLLLRLLAGLERCDSFVVTGEDDQPDLDVEIIERLKYTTTLVLNRCFDADGRLMSDLSMKVRLYHDARLAEVISYQGCYRIPPPHTARTMGGRYHKDEKRQINCLLHELLRYCVHCNYRGIGVSECAGA